MKKKYFIYDNPMIYLIILIIGIGIVMMYSASSTVAFNKFDDYSFYLNKHIIRLIIGFCALFIMYNVNFKYYNIYAKELLILSWLILICAYFFNEGATTRRWLIVGGKNLFTTSDFAKFTLIIFTANFIENNKKNINELKLLISNYLPYLLISLGLIFFQPDLSTTFAISIILISMLIIGGLEIKYIAIPIFISFILIVISVINTPYQYKRLSNWINGIHNTQIEHSVQALGNGGFFGTGIGNSIIKDGFMPEVHTDFILPIIGEELGFLGIVIIFSLFLILYFQGIKICKKAPNIFSSMLALGLTINILYYFLINASYIVGLLPTTGLPIPFISYGGSHTLFTLISVGLLLNISSYNGRYNYKKLIW